MNRFASRFIATISLVAATAACADPAKVEPAWKNFGSSSTYSVDIDMNSVKLLPKGENLMVHSTIRTNFFEGLKVEGQKKLGTYSIASTVIDCAADTMTFIKVVLYAKDGTPLSSTQNVVARNENIEGNFVTAYVLFMCNHTKEEGKAPEIKT